jgi:hypothetical protein
MLTIIQLLTLPLSLVIARVPFASGSALQTVQDVTPGSPVTFITLISVIQTGFERTFPGNSVVISDDSWDTQLSASIIQPLQSSSLF